VLTSVRHVTRLPQLLVGAAQATVDSALRVSGLQQALIDPLGSLERGLSDILALLPALASDLERVRATIEPQHDRVAGIEQTITRLEARINDLHGTLRLLKVDVHDVTEHLPDPDTPGPLARARDALAGHS
jgi:hypothetical protein